MSKRSRKPASAHTNILGNNKKSPHITKITANSSHEKEAERQSKSSEIIPETVVTDGGETTIRPADNTQLNQPKKLTRAEKKAAKLAKHNEEERPVSTYFILARPFVTIGRYLRDSWREIRQVRWPNRKATWKMTLAVLVYVAFFMIFLTLLDVFFTFIFDLLFGK